MDLISQPSEHASVREAYEIVHQAGLSNTVDRFVAQGPRCPFCEQGIRCAICSQGPCRILPRANRGVCGIDADGLVMRNLVHLNIMGLAAYSHHEREVARTLIATGRGQTPFTIQEPDRLAQICQQVGLSGKTPEAQAVALGERIIAEMNRDYYEESQLVEIFAPESRKALWRELGIFPGGALAEIQTGGGVPGSRVGG